MARKCVLMAGGGTGGHVMPLLAVAEVLRERGHGAVFVGTRAGFEARLVPARGFTLEYIHISGFQGKGLAGKLRLLWQLPASIVKCLGYIARYRPAACFSLGGYVAAPPVVASLLCGLPLVIMEPNAIPGMVHRRVGRWARKALLSFPPTRNWFRPEAVEVTGMPVREPFFAIGPRAWDGTLRVLVTGGSQGSQTLNRAMRELWPLLEAKPLPVELTHQCGRKEYERLAGSSRVTPFIEDMPRAFAGADFIVSRAGAGTVSELCAAGRASLLVPYPHAADDHQAKNAAAMVEAGAALSVRDEQLTGQYLYDLLASLVAEPARLEGMAKAAKALAKPGAAARAADILMAISKT